MSLSQSDLEHLCRLAKLDPDDAAKQLFAAQCGDILRYMDTLAEVDTEGVAPLYSPVSHFSASRDDDPMRTQSAEAILAGAPATDGTYFMVPRIVEGK
jgi:aspartyl-tRNA(Asn)/glutamyl-tRNA(Gln) amidotransferase subunit C